MARSKSNTVIIEAKRTPIGKRNGVFKSIKAHELGGALIKSVLDARGHQIDEVIMGNMIGVSADAEHGIRPRQNPAMEACIKGGYGFIHGWTLGDACSSALKSVMIGDRSIRSGDCTSILAGGMESMSGLPKEWLAMVLKDPDDLFPLHPTDYFSHGFSTLEAGEWCAKYCGISSKDQNYWTSKSYLRARKAQADGVFNTQIVPINGITLDEEPTLPITEDMILNTAPILKPDGTITYYSASKNADGAAVTWLMDPLTAKKRGFKPLAEIISQAASQTIYRDTRQFTVEPSQAIRLALRKVDLSLSDMDIIEINAPFASVIVHAIRELGLPENKVNIYGDSIAFGHPIGASGAILLVRAIYALHATGGRYAIICLCHALGGATAMVIRRM